MPRLGYRDAQTRRESRAGVGFASIAGMAAKPEDRRRLNKVLKDADSACRESERIRGYAEDVLRRRPFWPERRHDSRHETPPHRDDPESHAHS
jgi:hypothetical protein